MFSGYNIKKMFQLKKFKIIVFLNLIKKIHLKKNQSLAA
jgi:hypothetical protein